MEGGIPDDKIVVKNTFIDLVKLELPSPSRIKSAPPRTHDPGRGIGDDEEEEDEEDEEEDEDDEEEDGTSGPSIEALHRCVTCEGWEDREYWENWYEESDMDSFSRSQSLNESHARGRDLNVEAGEHAGQEAKRPEENASIGQDSADPAAQHAAADGKREGAAPQRHFPQGGVLIMSGVSRVIGMGTLDGCPPNCVAVPVGSVPVPLPGSAYSAYARWPGPESNGPPSLNMLQVSQAPPPPTGSQPPTPMGPMSSMQQMGPTASGQFPPVGSTASTMSTTLLAPQPPVGSVGPGGTPGLPMVSSVAQQQAPLPPTNTLQMPAMSLTSAQQGQPQVPPPPTTSSTASFGVGSPPQASCTSMSPRVEGGPPTSSTTEPPPPPPGPPQCGRFASTETPAPRFEPTVEDAQASAPSRPAAMPTQVGLSRAKSASSGIYRIHVTVPARILTTKDRSYVSPQFELPVNGKDCPFRLTLWPKMMSLGRGGACFQKAKGKGRVELKSEGDFESPSCLTFKISIGSANGKKEAPRGPVEHNFAEQPCAGLKDGKEIWNFADVVDEATGTFVVCLEVTPGSSS